LNLIHGVVLFRCEFDYGEVRSPCKAEGP
jgi:hypothetical protein